MGGVQDLGSTHQAGDYEGDELGAFAILPRLDVGNLGIQPMGSLGGVDIDGGKVLVGQRLKARLLCRCLKVTDFAPRGQGRG